MNDANCLALSEGADGATAGGVFGAARLWAPEELSAALAGSC